MGKRTLFTLLGLGLAGVGLYALRRRIVARLLKLPPAQYQVGVERNLRVPMPDGVGLMTDHYFPKGGGPFPTILIRSTYGRGSDVSGFFKWVHSFLADRFAERGYHVLYQTTRGRFDSEGEPDPFLDAGPDGQATLAWIARQPWFDGNLGMWGPSYLGYVQWAVAATAPPYLKALAPSVIASQFQSITYPDGAFALDTMLRWIYLIEVMDHRGQLSAWQMMLKLSPLMMYRHLKPIFQHLPLIETDILALDHEDDDYRHWLTQPQTGDPFWQSTDYSPAVAQVTIPVHLTSGWYDFMLRELLADYATLIAAGRSPYLTIGPWAHMDPPLMVEALREGFFWFEAQLKDNRRWLREKPVRIYMMGANEWRELDHWPPPARETRYYLQANRHLSTQSPAANSAPDHYTYDPADPTPTVGGPLLYPPAGPVDNRILEARPDVLCYTSPPLAHEVEAIGPVRVELFVKSSLTHTDFLARVCDVQPDGRSTNICDGLLRIEPGRGEPQSDGTLRLVINLWPTAYRFRQGHRLRLQISSGAHPRWNRNLGTGEPIATATKMLVAEQTIYHGPAHPSALVLPVTT